MTRIKEKFTTQLRRAGECFQLWIQSKIGDGVNVDLQLCNSVDWSKHCLEAACCFSPASPNVMQS